MATDIFFTNNPADYAKLPGLYVTERNPPGFIRGIDLSTTGLATMCERGPTTPVTITSVARFTEVFGDGYLAGNLIGQGWLALVNKPFGSLVIRRTAAAAAAKATHSFSDVVPTAIIRVDASGVGTYGNAITAQVLAATDAVSTHFNLSVVLEGNTYLFENLDCSTGNNNLALTVGTDDARPVDIVKLADGRPLTGSATALSSGSDGTIAASDYVTAMGELATFPGIGVCLVPEAIPSASSGITTYHSALVTLAAASSDRLFLTWAQAHGQSVSTEVAQVANDITTRSDRIVWCYNSPYTINPATGAEVQTAPHVWLASILSQIDVDIHAGSFDTMAFLAGITRLTNVALTRLDLISLQDAGISTLERLVDGFLFRSVVTTSLQLGRTELTRRRMCDFLQLSASSRLRHYVKAKGTDETRAMMASELTAFSQGLKLQGRIIQDFAIDQVSVNTKAERAQGTEQLLWTVDLIDHVLALVLQTEIGTGVVIEANGA